MHFFSRHFYNHYMNNVVLIIIYNHQYNANIDILEKLYKNRFSNIYHLVPFYNGDKSNVIPVYDNSFYFQGYVSQGFSNYYNECYEHYFFVSDDLVLNPVINETNYAEHLKLNSRTSFIPELRSLHDVDGWWARVSDAFHWKINRISGVEVHNQLPKYDVAIEKFQQYGLRIDPLRFDQIWRKPSNKAAFIDLFKNNRRYVFRYMKNKITKKTYNLSYPLIGSYSDIFVVSSLSIKQFCHYCGVFAATKLFVEVGLPTSLVLSAEEIVIEKNLKLKGKALWTKEQLSELDVYNYSLSSLISNFPKEYLYLHPVKLSKWTIDI